MDLVSGVLDFSNVPFGEELALSDEEFAAVMQRIGLQAGEPGTTVSAFNSSV